MRVESSVLSLSWIPSEMITGVSRMAFDRGLLHYDDPPPEHIENLEALRVADRFRFAHDLRCWIEVAEGRVVDHAQDGGGHIGVTRLRIAGRDLAFAAVPFPLLRPVPEVSAEAVRFTQTFGCRTGVPAPRPVPRKPFVQWVAPSVWTTLALTLHADGRVERELVGASRMPRHWLYDHEGRLVAKSAVVDLATWQGDSFGQHTPWGEQDSPALVSAVESALERQLSAVIMHGGPPPALRDLAAGQVLVEQGEPGRELFLLLDGLLDVDIDGEVVTTVGPGAVLGEQAVLRGGRRTATLRAATRCRVAAVPEEHLDRDALVGLSGQRQH